MTVMPYCLLAIWGWRTKHKHPATHWRAGKCFSKTFQKLIVFGVWVRVSYLQVINMQYRLVWTLMTFNTQNEVCYTSRYAQQHRRLSLHFHYTVCIGRYVMVIIKYRRTLVCTNEVRQSLHTVPACKSMTIYFYTNAVLIRLVRPFLPSQIFLTNPQRTLIVATCWNLIHCFLCVWAKDTQSKTIFVGEIH